MNSFFDIFRKMWLLIFFGFIGIYFIWALTNNTFDYDKALMLSRDAGCAVSQSNNDGFEIPSMDLKIESTRNCKSYYKPEDFMYNFFDFIIFFIVIVPLSITILIFWWSRNADLAFDKNTKRVGNITISSARDSVGWNYADTDDFKFRAKNVKDIVRRKVICKGDYTTWFGHFAKDYIKSYPKYVSFISKKRVIKYLNWGIEATEYVYAGKDKEAGIKRAKTLQKFIDQLENMQ